MIFRNSTHVADWQENNCFQCAKYGKTMDETSCELINEIEMTCCGAPELPAELFKPLGFDNGKPPERCLQRTPLAEEPQS